MNINELFIGVVISILVLVGCITKQEVIESSNNTIFKNDELDENIEEVTHKAGEKVIYRSNSLQNFYSSVKNDRFYLISSGLKLYEKTSDQTYTQNIDFNIKNKLEKFIIENEEFFWINMDKINIREILQINNQMALIFRSHNKDWSNDFYILFMDNNMKIINIKLAVSNALGYTRTKHYKDNIIYFKNPIGAELPTKSFDPEVVSGFEIHAYDIEKDMSKKVFQYNDVEDFVGSYDFLINNNDDFIFAINSASWDNQLRKNEINWYKDGEINNLINIERKLMDKRIELELVDIKENFLYYFEREEREENSYAWKRVYTNTKFIRLNLNNGEIETLSEYENRKDETDNFNIPKKALVFDEFYYLLFENDEQSHFEKLYFDNKANEIIKFNSYDEELGIRVIDSEILFENNKLMNFFVLHNNNTDERYVEVQVIEDFR